MSRLIKLGRFGQVYVGWHEDERAPLSCQREGRSVVLACRGLQVIASPPEEARRWGVV